MYFFEDLLEECNAALRDFDPSSEGIARTQLFKDIKFMEDAQGYDVSLLRLRHGRKFYYRYEDINFSINNQPLNEKEAQQLKESLMTLSRFKGMPQFEWVDEIKVRLEQSFNLTSEEHVLSFEENPYLTGREYIGDLYNHIINKKTLQIRYQPFNWDTPGDFEIHPYHLKQYNNRWFLFGKDHKNGFVINMPLDRIEAIEISKTTFEPNTEIDFEEYFEDVIGVSVPFEGEPQKVILKIDKSLWPYIKTKPVHGSQKVVNETTADDSVLIQLELFMNYELESLILSFGDKVEVMEPTALRTKIKNRISRLAKNYKVV
jgi:predicted DNA-binding transcriptional regulator YafY